MVGCDTDTALRIGEVVIFFMAVWRISSRAEIVFRETHQGTEKNPYAKF